MRRTAFFLVLLMIGMTVGGQSNRIPGFQVEDEIWPDPGTEGGQFGAAVATDGERIAIGAPGEAAVYVYERVSATWVLQQRIQGSHTSFGAAVAIDGTVLVVGSPESSPSLLATNAGRIDVYDLGDSWQHRQAWTCPDVRAEARCGEAVALEEGRIFVGEPGSPLIQDVQPGRVHMLSERLVLQHSHAESSASGLRFGAAIDVHGDQILVGAPARIGTDEVLPGGAFFYDRHGTNWILRESYRANPDLNTAETYGQNVAIDGIDAIVTTLTHYDVDTAVYISGRAFFYERAGNTWPLIDQVSTELQAVALHNGSAVLGAWFWDALFVYHKFDQQWWMVGWLGDFSFNGRDDEYGFALAYEGRMMAAGAPTASRDGRETGAAFAYYDNWPPWAYAGQDRRIDDVDEDGVETIEFDGSQSWDYDGTIVAYRWFLDDAIISREATFTWTLPLGNHTVTLEVEDDVGAIDRDSVRVWVRRAVTEASFDWEPRNPWPGQSVRFIDYSADQRSPIKEWAWDLDGDGTDDNWQQQPWTHFEHGGPHDVRLTTTNQDGQTLQATATINVQRDWPEAFGGWSRVVSLDETGLTATTMLDGRGSRTDGEITSWSWSTNGRSLGSEPQVEATLPRGENQIFLEIRDDRGWRDMHASTILALPGDANETAVNRPDPNIAIDAHWNRFVALENTGDTGPIQLWDLDNDGEPDAEGRFAQHTFSDPGEHEVRLTVVNREGAKEERTRTIHIVNEPPGASFWPDHAVVPEGTYLIHRGTSHDEAPLAAWQWQFTDGVTSTHTDVGRVYDRIGNVTIEFTVTDDGGLQATHKGSVEVLSLADWEARFGEFQPDVLLNATKDDAPAALGGTVTRTPPSFTATETRDPSPTQQADEDEREPPAAPEVWGIPVWIPGLLLLLIVAIVLIVAPMRRR